VEVKSDGAVNRIESEALSTALYRPLSGGPGAGILNILGVNYPINKLMQLSTFY
jgi:hypothetical protein